MDKNNDACLTSFTSRKDTVFINELAWKLTKLRKLNRKIHCYIRLLSKLSSELKVERTNFKKICELLEVLSSDETARVTKIDLINLGFQKAEDIKSNILCLAKSVSKLKKARWATYCKMQNHINDTVYFVNKQQKHFFPEIESRYLKHSLRLLSKKKRNTRKFKEVGPSTFALQRDGQDLNKK